MTGTEGNEGGILFSSVPFGMPVGSMPSMGRDGKVVDFPGAERYNGDMWLVASMGSLWTRVGNGTGARAPVHMCFQRGCRDGLVRIFGRLDSGTVAGGFHMAGKYDRKKFDEALRTQYEVEIARVDAGPWTWVRWSGWWRGRESRADGHGALGAGEAPDGRGAAGLLQVPWTGPLRRLSRRCRFRVGPPVGEASRRGRRHV